MDAKYELLLQEKGIRPTAMRLLILKELDNSASAINLNELELLFEKADKVTLYRTINTFEENQLIHSIIDGKGSVRYALCSDGCTCSVNDAHVHFHCDVCGQTMCLKNISVPAVTLPDDYMRKSLSYVISGTCSGCISK
jgi:Fur family transcriptional regulator, ferric uptake regulator